MSQRPDQVEVEFSLKASANAGFVVASGSLEANYTVKLIWKSASGGDGASG